MSTDLEACVDRVVASFRRAFAPRKHGWRLLEVRPDLTMTQLRVLMILTDREPMTIGALGEQLAVGDSAASRLVERLVSERLVERADDPADRRRALVRVAVLGRDVIDQVHRDRREMHDRLRHLLRQLPPRELAQLGEIMAMLADAADAEAGECD